MTLISKVFTTPGNHLMSNEILCLSPSGIPVSMDGHKTVTDNSGILELFWPVDTETARVVEKPWPLERNSLGW